MGFEAIPVPTDEQCRQLLVAAPHNPFFTSSYLAARRDCGARPWLLSMSEEGVVVSGCTALETKRRSGRALEIPSVPPDIQDNDYWAGLKHFCRELGVDELVINSFSAAPIALPDSARRMWHRKRREYVWDLRTGDEFVSLSSNHRRNIKRARKEGMALRIVDTPEGCRAHGQLVRASLTRRKARGEQVAEQGGNTIWDSFVANGAALIYQATHEGEPVSSLLVLLAPEGAYYQSAGTSPDGMAKGASHFVVESAAADLRLRGVQRFNLGGVGLNDDGLSRFKAGFGAAQVELEAAAFWVGRRSQFAIKRGIDALLRLRQVVRAPG